MRVFQTLLLLLLVCAVQRTSAGVLGASWRTTPNLFLSILSARNKTGHWIISFDTKQILRQGKPTQVSVDVEQGLGYLNGSNIVQLTGTAILQPQTSGAPAGYQDYDGIGYYKVHLERKSWDDANQTCVDEGAHLIVIDSDEEATLLKNLYARNIVRIENGGARTVHVGAHDKEVEGQFMSVVGVPIYLSSLVQWATNQPEGGTSENCVSSGSNVQLYSNPCKTMRSFICEWESIL